MRGGEYNHFLRKSQKGCPRFNRGTNFGLTFARVSNSLVLWSTLCHTARVKLTAKVKLQPTPNQHKLLLETLERANSACNQISLIAFDQKVFNKFDLQGICYHTIKQEFSLTAQIIVRCVSKVSDAYKLDNTTRRRFKPRGAIAYDARILRYTSEQEVSIWTVDGRETIPYVCSEQSLELLKQQRGQSDLVFIKGQFYLFATCEVETPEPIEPEGVLGVDLGIVNLATDSDGHKYSGAEVRSLRKRHRRQRKRLQSKGTRSAKRVLKKLSGKERRFAKNENHRIAKQIVKTAKDTGRAIAIEELKGIRDRVTVGRQQRSDLHSWAFGQLIALIIYKAALAGVRVVEINPRNTSRRCSACGFTHKNNRKTQDRFSCGQCGLRCQADHNAALNIASQGWGQLSGPHESSGRNECLTGSSSRFYRG